MGDEAQGPKTKGTPGIPAGSMAHRILAVASATPRHWFELEDLATRRGMRLYDKTTITAALRALANQELLKRHQGPQDGNVQQYTLTPKGEAALDALHSPA